LAFLDSEYLFPLAAKETNRIYIEEIKEQTRNSLFTKDRFWYKSDDGAIWNIGHVNIDKRTLSRLAFFRFDADHRRIVSRVTADEGRIEGENWVFANYVERTFATGGAFAEERWDVKRTPLSLIASDDFAKVALDPEEMNLAQMSAYIRDLKTKGYDTTRYQAEKHAKIAFPLISLVMPLIAFPLGIRSSRAGGALVGIGVALAIGAAFWFMFSMGVAFGRAGRLPSEFSAYAPHALFASLGLYLLLSKRQ